MWLQCEKNKNIMWMKYEQNLYENNNVSRSNVKTMLRNQEANWK